MTWVKICGITNLEDALVAAKAGADALGFVFYEKSPRKVTVEQAKKVISSLTMPIEKVGVFVADSPETANRMAAEVGLSAIQLHSLNGGFQNGLTHDGSSQTKHYFAVPMNTFLAEKNAFAGIAANVTNPSSKNPITIFLDSGTPNQPGGTGKSFDWLAARPIAEGFKNAGWNLVVAGGLTPENVGKAISILRPWGVDVSSGVEARIGKKDPEKICAFIQAVLEADKVSSN